MKFPDKFYLAIMSSFKGRARGALLDHPTWMCGTKTAGYFHWSSIESERTIFQAKGPPNRFILSIYKSYENRQKGSLAGHPSWVYNGTDSSFNYTSVEREATVFKLVAVPSERGGGYALEILQSYQNRAKGADMGHKSWMYNECKEAEGCEGIFGYSSVEREATVFIICEFEDQLSFESARVVDMSFEMGKVAVNEKPYMLLQATYNNKSGIDLTMSSEHSKETKKTRVFEWNPDSSIKIGAKHTMSCETPFVTMSGEVGFEDSNAHSLGKENVKENDEIQKWILPFPAVIPPKTSLTMAASVSQGRLVVPFIATMQRGGKQWKEEGTFRSINYFGLRVDCFGLKIEANNDQKRPFNTFE